MKRMIAVVVALTTTVALADIVHKTPSAQEKAAIDKAVTVMNGVISRFANDSWTADSDSTPDYETISGEPSGPLDAGLDFNRKFTVTEGTPLYQSKVLPAMTALQKAVDGKDFTSAAKLGDAINGTFELTLETSVNEPVAPHGDGVTRIDAKGATLAAADKSVSNEWSVYVGVGDWTHAKPSGDSMRYTFKNARNTPHIENIVFHFRTRKDSGVAADRIREIVRTTDWSVLNQGLTP